MKGKAKKGNKASREIDTVFIQGATQCDRCEAYTRGMNAEKASL